MDKFTGVHDAWYFRPGDRVQFSPMAGRVGKRSWGSIDGYNNSVTSAMVQLVSDAATGQRKVYTVAYSSSAGVYLRGIWYGWPSFMLVRAGEVVDQLGVDDVFA